MKLLICRRLQYPVTSFLLRRNILLSTLQSNTLSPLSSLNVRDQVSQPHKQEVKLVLYIRVRRKACSFLSDCKTARLSTRTSVKRCLRPHFCELQRCCKMAALQPIYHSNIPISSLCLLHQLLQNGCLALQFYISQPSYTSARHHVIHERHSNLIQPQPVIITKLYHSVKAVIPINIYPMDD
jgi:hypothetical protein